MTNWYEIRRWRPQPVVGHDVPSRRCFTSRVFVLGVVSILIVLASYGIASARSISLTGSLVHHYWQGMLQYTQYDGTGVWTPDEGDTFDSVVSEHKIGDSWFGGIDGAGTVDQNNVWSAAHYTAHYGGSTKVRGVLVFTNSEQEQDALWSSESGLLSCEP